MNSSVSTEVFTSISTRSIAVIRPLSISAYIPTVGSSASIIRRREFANLFLLVGSFLGNTLDRHLKEQSPRCPFLFVVLLLVDLGRLRILLERTFNLQYPSFSSNQKRRLSAPEIILFTYLNNPK